MKIVIAGKDWESSADIRNALSGEDYEIQQLTFDTLKVNIVHPSSAALLILNFSDSNQKDLQKFQPVLSSWAKDLDRVISFIPYNSPGIRSGLLKSGLDQILELPFSHSELRLVVENFLKKNAQPPGKTKDLPRAESLDGYFQIFDTIINNKMNLAAVNNWVLKYYNTQVKIPHIYFFEVITDTEAVLRYYVSANWTGENLKINFHQLIESHQANHIIINENQGTDHPKNLYLKSILNLPAKCFILCPVRLQHKIKFLYLFIQTDFTSFTELQKILIYHFQKIVEFEINKQLPLTTDKKSELLKPEYSSASFFRGILDQLNFGIVIFNEQLEIKYINREGLKLIHFKEESLQNQTLENLFGEQNTAVIKTTMSLASGAFERPEIELMTPAGQKILIGFTLTEYVDPSDQQKGFILSLKDITYTKELQEEMIRMDRLASLGVMASGIAHEIRNPLAGIKAIAQTFEEELSKNDPKNEYVKRIIKQVNRLDDLLKSLFSYAKPPKPNRQFFVVKELVQEVLSLLQQRMQKHNINFIQSYEKNLPSIFIDGAQIQQVIFNLILNSIEAIEKQGEIKLAAKKVKKNDEIFQRKPFQKKVTDQPYIQILITDTGSGISPENLLQIFNPFFTTKNYGTGLGLSIVYQIVQENNGVIYFESDITHGTQCYLFLPCFQTINKDSLKK
ncbi:MAG: hypothetical protein A2Y94_05140 [Caldithrix sp. RBG_13_44_9]|nr:MAG: hypothetical protein A2Y94_05140 [Caldithrix sp. RBG_13_44_9]